MAGPTDPTTQVVADGFPQKMKRVSSSLPRGAGNGSVADAGSGSAPGELGRVR